MTREELDFKFNETTQVWEPGWKVYRDGPEVIEELRFGEARARQYSRKKDKLAGNATNARTEQ